MVNSEALGGRWSVLWTYGLRGRGAGFPGGQGEAGMQREEIMI